MAVIGPSLVRILDILGEVCQLEGHLPKLSINPLHPNVDQTLERLLHQPVLVALGQRLLEQDRRVFEKLAREIQFRAGCFLEIEQVKFSLEIEKSNVFLFSARHQQHIVNTDWT